MKVIGVSGKARHGKDTCAGIIRRIAEQEFGVRTAIWNLAHPLKARVYGEAAGTLTIEDVWVTKPPALRTRLQQAGTEQGRNVFGEDFWLYQNEALMRLLVDGADVELVIVPDIRFPNEVEFSHFNGQVPSRVRAEAARLGALAVGLTPEVESDLLEHDVAALLSMETEAQEHYGVLLGAERVGHCYRIRSNRPTLTGPAAEHPSETALDDLPDSAFTAVIDNDKGVTFADLRSQLRPLVKRALDRV